VGDCGTSARPVSFGRQTESAIVVWDTSNGTVLKNWPHTRSKVNADFAPNRPLLAVVETWGPAAGGKGPKPLEDRPNTSTLGFWDLSGLLK